MKETTCGQVLLEHIKAVLSTYLSLIGTGLVLDLFHTTSGLMRASLAPQLAPYSNPLLTKNTLQIVISDSPSIPQPVFLCAYGSIENMIMISTGQERIPSRTWRRDDWLDGRGWSHLRELRCEKFGS